MPTASTLPFPLSSSSAIPSRSAHHRLEPPQSAHLPTDEIVAEIRQGNVEAYRFLVDRYQNEVLKVVNAMLIDVSLREDVVQQVFVRAFQKLSQYQIGRGFDKWLKAIARNLVREELRKRYRYHARLESYGLSVLDNLESNPDPGAAEESLRRRSALESCLAELEDTSAQIVRLHYLENLSTAEIGARLNRSGGSIRTLLYRIRSVLRSCLTTKGILP